MKIAILEDNPGMRHVLQLNLANTGHEIHLFQATRDFFTFFSASNIDLLITDYFLKSEQEKSGMTGADVISRVRKDRPELPVILISAAPRFEIEEACRDIDGVRIMQKPFGVSRLLEAIRELSK